MHTVTRMYPCAGAGLLMLNTLGCAPNPSESVETAAATEAASMSSDRSTDDAETTRGDVDTTVTDDGGDADTRGESGRGGETDPDGPDLPGQCDAGSTRCAEDGGGFQACGWDFDAGEVTWGWRIPCESGETCSDGRCSMATCRAPELAFVVDRSDSMLTDDRWDWVSGALGSLERSLQVASVGVRMFPDGDCSTGPLSPLAPLVSGFEPLLDPPTTGASTPISLALQGLQPAFGDPNVAQAVVMITDGDETCLPDAEPLLTGSNLFRAGIVVYTIAVSSQANPTLLDGIALGGGSGSAFRVETRAELEAAVETILDDLDSCRCEPGANACSGGVAMTCSADGTEFETAEACAGECADDGESCLGGLGEGCEQDQDCGCHRSSEPDSAACGAGGLPLSCRNTSMGSICTMACGTGLLDPPSPCHDDGVLIGAPGTTCDMQWCLPPGGVRCGDGIVQGAEQCDGDDLDGQTCILRMGTLACTERCTLDTSDCTLQP